MHFNMRREKRNVAYKWSSLKVLIIKAQRSLRTQLISLMKERAHAKQITNEISTHNGLFLQNVKNAATMLLPLYHEIDRYIKSKKKNKIQL